jgi:hypothetical protein
MTRIQKSLLSAIITLGCLFGIVLALRDATFRYLDSPAFRERLEQAGNAKLQLNTTISHPLQREGTRLFASNVSLENNGHPWLKTVRSSGLSATLSLRKLFAGAWEITDTHCGKLEVHVATPTTEPSPPPSNPVPLPFPASLLPTKTLWESARADSATIIWRDLRIDRTALTLKKEGANWRIQLSGGEARFAFLPPFQLRTAELSTSTEGTVFIKNAELHSPQGGIVRITGSASPANTKLNVQVQSLPLGEILPATWHSRLHGQADASLTAEISDRTAPSLRGDIALAKASLEGFPFLSTLDQLVGSSKFRLVPLETARASLTWSDGTYALSGLELDSHRVLKIRGDARIATDTLAFKGKLGIAVPTLAFLPNLKLQIFGDPADGHYWIPLELQGDHTSLVDSSASTIPTPNLSKLPDAIPESVERLKKKAVGLFEALGDGVKRIPNLIAPQLDKPEKPPKSSLENR